MMPVRPIWGLETDYGADNGNSPQPLARFAGLRLPPPDKFRGEVDCRAQDRRPRRHGAADMHGAWAGEIGQTQFLPSSYLKFAVDYDGNGRRDLIHSVRERARFDGELSERHGWTRAALGRRHAQFPGACCNGTRRRSYQDRRRFAQQLADGPIRSKTQRFNTR